LQCAAAPITLQQPPAGVAVLFKHLNGAAAAHLRPLAGSFVCPEALPFLLSIRPAGIVRHTCTCAWLTDTEHTRACCNGLGLFMVCIRQLHIAATVQQAAFLAPIVCMVPLALLGAAFLYRTWPVALVWLLM
jgi:hypothetical protein